MMRVVLPSGPDRLRVRAIVIFFACIFATSLSSAQDTNEWLEAEELYFGEWYVKALDRLEALAEQHPEDALLAYRVYFSMTQLPHDDAEVESWRKCALELMTARLRADPDPISVYYTRILEEDGDLHAPDAGWAAEIDRHLPDPDPSLGVFSLSRLALMAWYEKRPAEDTAAILRAMFAAEEGAWVDELYLVDLVYLLVPVGRELGTVDEYEQVLNRAIASRPQSATQQLTRASFFFKLGRIEDASTAMDRALELMPDNPRDLAGAGDQLIDLDRLEEAIVVARRATEITPENGYAWNVLGRSLYLNRQSDEAVEAFQIALGLEDNREWTLVMLGRALAWSDRNDEAEATFREAIDSFPRSRWPRRVLADFYSDHDRYAEGLELLDAPDLDDEPSAKFLIERVRCLRGLDRFDEAIMAARVALEQYPGDTKLQYHLRRARLERLVAGPVAVDRYSLLVVAALPLTIVLLLPHRIVGFVPRTVVCSRWINLALVGCLFLMCLPWPAVLLGLLPWESDPEGSWILAASWYIGASIAVGIVAFCFGYVTLFQRYDRKQTLLRVAQVVLGLELVGLSLFTSALAWLVVTATAVG